MRVALFLLGVTALAGSLALPQETTSSGTKNPTGKALAPVAKKTATTKSPATKTGTTAKTGKALPKSTTAKSTKSGKKTPPPVRQRTQLTPTPERYRDIQTALVEKGYLHGEPTGVWDNDSVDAMRRFQTDQKQTPTGKITASALIGLGLGPKPADSSPLVPAPGGPVTPPSAVPAPAPDSAPPP